MSFINHIENNFIEIIKLLIFTMIIIFINFAIIMLQSKKDIQDNWNTYRCNPLVMPLASFFGHDTFSNFGQCLFTQTAGFTGTFLQPIHYMMQIITSIFGDFSQSIQQIRQVIFQIRMFFQWIINDIMKRFQNVTATLQFFLAKLKDIFAKSYAIFVTVGYMMYTTYETFLSMWNGPIGWTAKTLCFDKNTLIVMKNKTLKKILDIKINDELCKGGKVLGLLKFKSVNNDMYNYEDIIVSGSHLVKENNKFVRINSSKKSQKIDKFTNKYIYCLITENNCLLINNKKNIIEFSDYIETHNPSKNHIIKQLTLSRLNLNQIDPSNIINYESVKKNYYLTGFYKNTMLQLNNGNYKKIKDIRIGDLLQNGMVTGIIKQKILDPSDIVQIQTNKQSIILSKHQIIYDKIWKKTESLENIKPLKKLSYKYLYNLCIDKEELQIDNLLFRDYLENYDGILINFFNNYI